GIRRRAARDAGGAMARRSDARDASRVRRNRRRTVTRFDEPRCRSAIVGSKERRLTMDFGTLIFTKPERAITDVKFAEEHGFSHAWFPDSHMIWGDPFVSMALAALNTKTIKLGTGVVVASSRIAPVTVHSIATINQLAPGRVILGFGTGHTGRRVMGLPPVKQVEFRDQVRLINNLLRDGEAIYNTEAVSRKIRFLHRDRRFIDLEDKIPFYVAAN